MLNNNLPADLSSFIGRRRETTEIRSLLSGSRLITLVGMGGVGKTRLARRVASSCTRSFADGVWWVDLSAVHDPDLLVPLVAGQVGLREPSESWTIESLGSRLRPRELLIVLDNCEHIIASAADLARLLLQSCPTLSILATSREALGVHGERTYIVYPLSVPPRDAATRSIQDYDAVRLLLDRAAEAAPAFELDESNERAVGQLCTRLEGLPLAIELAAVWLRTVSAEDLVQQLTEHYDLLTHGYRDLPPRQRSLGAMVDWSYQLCGSEEQAVWRRATLFNQGFEMDAIAALFTGELSDREVVDLVDRLVMKSILFTDRQDGHVRFRMPEIVKAYGRERLVELGEVDAVQLARLAWCSGLAASAGREWASPAQLKWFLRVRRELANIRAALEYSLSTAQGGGDVVGIVAPLTDYWTALGILSEPTLWLRRALATDLTLDQRLTALRSLALLATVQGDAQQVEQTLERAWSVAEGRASEYQEAWLVFASALAALYANNHAEARRGFADAEVRFRALNEVNGLVLCLSGSTVNESACDDPSATGAHFSRYLAFVDVHNERWTRTYTTWAVAMASWRMGEFAAARKTLGQSLRLRADFNDEFALGHGLELLAWIEAAEGRYTQAAMLLGRSDSAFFAVGSSVAALHYLIDSHNKCKAEVIAKLGEAPFQHAFEAGRTLSRAEYDVLANVDTSPHGAGTAPQESASSMVLTRRQSEVALLVAQGLSNKEIAKRLQIAIRTAEAHVENILVRCGFTSRSQVAAWVAAGDSRQPKVPPAM